MESNYHLQASQEGHFKYTIDEWENGDYFKSIVSVFKESKIKNFIDIGANVGGVAQVLLNHIPTIETGYLFEPQKDNYNFLLNNFKDSKKIICLNCGIYYGNLYSNLLSRNENVGGFTLLKQDDSFSPTDNYCSLFELEFFNFKPIDLIKMDIEGSEYNVIENSKFLQSVNFIEIELHKNFDSEYISHYFPNHHIIWYATWDNKINHILLKKNK